MRKIRLKGVSGDSMFLAFSKIITLLFGILTAKILSMGLTLTEYGTYSQANLVNTLSASLLLLGLPDALNFFYNNKDSCDKESREKYINTIFFIELSLWFVLFAFIIFGRGLIAAYFGNDAIKSLLPIVALIPVAANSISLYHVLYVSIGKAKVMATLSLFTTTVKIPFVYLAVYVFKNLVWIFVTIFALELIQITFFIVFLARRGIHVNPFNISSSKIKKILAYALPMGIYALTATLTRELAKLVVGRLAGTEQLAIYTNCSKILPLDFLVTSFAVVLIPYIVKYVSSSDKERSEAVFSQYLKVGYYSVWILGTMVLIAPETMISFLYSDEYVVGKGIFIIYIFDSMLRFASMHLILTSANKSRNVMIYSLIALGLNLVLNVAFYYAFGLIGPAIATLVVAVIYTYLIMRKSIKIIDTRWRTVFNIKEIIWLIFTLACLWAAMFGLNILLVNIGLHRYLSMILCMAIFGFSALGIHFKKISAILKNINSFRM